MNDQITRLGLVRPFQIARGLPRLSVLDNLRAASDPRDKLSYFTDLFWPVNPPLPGAVVAAINDSNPVTTIRLLRDGTQIYSTTTGKLDVYTSNLTAGAHTLTVTAQDSTGATFSNSVNVTVATTAGLFAKYGAARLCDTPICERGFVGLGCGAAMTGTMIKGTTHERCSKPEWRKRRGHQLATDATSNAPMRELKIHPYQYMAGPSWSVDGVQPQAR